MREIIKNAQEGNLKVILIHRYNSLDDTYIEYYITNTHPVVYKNTWKCIDNTEVYEKRGE